MTSLSDLVVSYTRTPAATVLLDGRPWRAIMRLRTSQAFATGGISSGTVEGRDPPTTPRIGMQIAWKWGYAGAGLVPGFTGEISDITDKSYPDTWSIECRDALWRADKSSQVIATDPLNEITAQDAIEYILTTFGGISASRLSIPALAASGSEWVGSEWVLGVLTPVQWGDSDTNSGGTTALRAAQEICSCLGYWLYADASGVVRAKLMERRPSSSPLRTFQRGVDLLVEGAPVRRQTYDSIYNQVTVRGANTGVDGAQIMDQFQTSHPLLPSGIYRDFSFSSFLIEYVNSSEAGAASAGSIAQRILGVLSRTPDIIAARIKADPRIAVGATIGIKDSGVAISSTRNFFVYQLDTSLDLQTGAFDQQMTLDGGVGNTGYTTIPPPDAAFSWTLMTETLDGTAVVEVFLDGSGSLSLSGGEIVSWEWETLTTPYSGTDATATGEHATLIFPAAAGTADVTLTVTDTTSKIGTLTQTIDLTGADTAPPIERVIIVGGGSALYVTPDGGGTWVKETTNGDAVAVGIIGAGADDRAAASAATYGLLATRGALGAGGLRQTLNALATASTNLVSVSAAITSNIWVNEANPARVWFAVGDTVYRSIDGGATKTAMAKPAAGTNVVWIIEDPSVDDSVFVACGANLYHATAPTVGWVVLYAGPTGATAKQFVRSRDGQVTWVCYTGTFTGDAAQRVENGAGADIAATRIRTLALDREAGAALATLYLIDGANPAAIYSVDGLTGLSAVTSTQTFPADAIVQHMLGDPDAAVFYTADFDSIAAGRGALRKYFPQADRLLLWKQLAVGEQGHMLGLGGAPVAPAEVLQLTGGVNPGGAWHYLNGGWILKTTGLPTSNIYWRWVAADPFNPDRWLLMGNTESLTRVHLTGGGEILMQDGVTRPLWYTIDAGLTWTSIEMPTASVDGKSVYMGRVEWDDVIGGEWAIEGAVSINAFQSRLTVWRGSTSAVVTTTPTDDLSTGSTVGFGVPALEGDTTASTDFNFGYLAAGDTTFTVVGSTVPPGNSIGDRLPGNTRALVVGASGDSGLYGTTDYRASAPSSLVASAGNYATATVEAIYCGGRTSGGVLRVADALGTPSSAVVAQAGQSIGFIRADRQTRTHVGAIVTALDLITLYDGSTWITISRAPLGGNLTDRIEVIVR